MSLGSLSIPIYVVLNLPGSVAQMKIRIHFSDNISKEELTYLISFLKLHIIAIISDWKDATRLRT